MDLDAYVAAHRGEWDRLARLSRRGRIRPEEADELVDLYQRVSTHLSVIRAESPDPALVARLTTVVARARGAVVGGSSGGLRELARFLTVVFPAAVYRGRRWWVTIAVLSLAVMVGLGTWVATHPAVQATIASPDAVQQLVGHQFADYYSAAPASDFAAKVWTNNAWVAALCIALGALLGLPVIYLLWQNVANVGVIAGLMIGHGRTALFFGLILPHGILELTAVFVAAATGLRLGWTVVSPGERTRSAALAEEGRAAGSVAIGLVGVLLCSGVIEAFVTPSHLPTWARISIGVLAETAFLTYVFVLGSRAVRDGEHGDLVRDEAGDADPVAA